MVGSVCSGSKVLTPPDVRVIDTNNSNLIARTHQMVPKWVKFWVSQGEIICLSIKCQNLLAAEPEPIQNDLT